MLFRKQLLFMLLVVASNGLGLASQGNLFKTQNVNFKLTDNTCYIVLFFISIVLSIISILKYKKRVHQFIINRINIMLSILIIGSIVYMVFKETYEITGFVVYIPLLNIILLATANKAIKKDEDLVRSVDRIR